MVGSDALLSAAAPSNEVANAWSQKAGEARNGDANMERVYIEKLSITYLSL
jgi:hypothetical protein